MKRVLSSLILLTFVLSSVPEISEPSAFSFCLNPAPFGEQALAAHLAWPAGRLFSLSDGALRKASLSRLRRTRETLSPEAPNPTRLWWATVLLRAVGFSVAIPSDGNFQREETVDLESLPEGPAKRFLLYVRSRPELGEMLVTGGTVRDLLLAPDQPPHDLDVYVRIDLSPEEQALTEKGRRIVLQYRLHERTQTLQALWDDPSHGLRYDPALNNFWFEDRIVDFLFAITLDGSFSNGIARDFTMNTIALSTTGKWFDPLEGMEAVRARELRLAPSRQSDLMALLRALRFKHQYGLTFSADLTQWWLSLADIRNPEALVRSLSRYRAARPHAVRIAKYLNDFMAWVDDLVDEPESSTEEFLQAREEFRQQLGTTFSHYHFHLWWRARDTPLGQSITAFIRTDHSINALARYWNALDHQVRGSGAQRYKRQKTTIIQDIRLVGLRDPESRVILKVRGLAENTRYFVTVDLPNAILEARLEARSPEVIFFDLWGQLLSTQPLSYEDWYWIIGVVPAIAKAFQKAADPQALVDEMIELGLPNLRDMADGFDLERLLPKKGSRPGRTKELQHAA